ncbi:MAG: hypothetical protein HYY84_08170 [Deltaproteobacteria bacterium]|nr:hypothetical protein [Deltaproteobacteria bacterium]
MSRFRKVVAAVLAVFVAGLAVENAVSMACPMEKSERCGCCDDKVARISDDANECCSVLSVARRASLPAELTPVSPLFDHGALLGFVVVAATGSIDAASTIAASCQRFAPPGAPLFLVFQSIRC